MSALISYIFLGLSLAAPIGPINAAQIDKGIKNGFLHSWLVGVGAMVADTLYMMLVYFVEVRFLHSTFMQVLMWSFGCFILLYTGIESLAGAGKIMASHKSKEESPWKSFLSGFIMSLSNPLTILFWIGIYGSVLAETAQSYDSSELMMYSAAIILGISIWDIAMAALASSFKRFLTKHVLSWISIVSGLSLIGFGFYFGWEAFKALFVSR
ncbi:LysE family transporter [Aneurinibacillus sp. Ricciae_BoGa-3]|uniref:LysE family transporter n=1 Tax=Aneurinibacillus sp. Ricciae_BoGa-3 TaxID=3022697 RepID=UPI002342853E|nr:LysE family transporter [Aneurinibacillus sp. Ricciae_BoGa-3]WCK55665.1 LysE family transporter [Aneurinibacillus sp. Ricciae_BoGa-3]